MEGLEALSGIAELLVALLDGIRSVFEFLASLDALADLFSGSSRKRGQP